MYKTVTFWLHGEGKKLEFRTDTKGTEPWLGIDDGNYAGDVTIHFDADGIRQLIFELEKLEKKMIEKGKEVKQT